MYNEPDGPHLIEFDARFGRGGIRLAYREPNEAITLYSVDSTNQRLTAQVTLGPSEGRRLYETLHALYGKANPYPGS